MKIQIDSREKDLIKEFEWQQIPHIVSHLHIGDLVLNQTVIERKRADDFVASICDNRIKGQCQNMLHNYKRAFLIVEGAFPADFNYHSVAGQMASIAVRMNIPILHTENINQTAYLAWKILEKLANGKVVDFEFALKSKERDKRLDILTIIDGVSLEKAKNIINHYPTFKDLVTAEVEDLEKVFGIGKKLAVNIHSFFSIFRY